LYLNDSVIGRPSLHCVPAYNVAPGFRTRDLNAVDKDISDKESDEADKESDKADKESE